MAWKPIRRPVLISLVWSAECRVCGVVDRVVVSMGARDAARLIGTLTAMLAWSLLQSAAALTGIRVKKLRTDKEGAWHRGGPTLAEIQGPPPATPVTPPRRRGRPNATVH